MTSQKPYYIITDGSRYIRENINNRLETIRNFVLADQYETKSIANNVLRKLRNRPKCKQFYVAKVDNGEIVNDSYAVPCDRALCDAAQSWLNRVSGLEDITQDAQQRMDELKNKQSEVEQIIKDLEHYIEFNTVNAATGYKLSAALRKMFIRRRNIKDELMVIDMICQSSSGSTIDVKHLMSCISGLKTRQYTPRVLTSLFEDGTIKL